MNEDERYDSILIAKVAMLERLVRALLRDAFLKAPDPAAAASSYAERFKAVRSDAQDDHGIIMQEIVDQFFDQLRHEVEKAARNRGT